MAERALRSERERISVYLVARQVDDSAAPTASLIFLHGHTAHGRIVSRFSALPDRARGRALLDRSLGDGDLPPGQFAAQASREADHPRLRGGIVGLARVP